MKLNEVFERIVIIKHPFEKERQERLKDHLRQIGIVDEDHVVWSRAICGDYTPPPAWWGACNSAWGCLMSHLRVAQDAVHDQVSSYCVLEDDVVFHPQAPAILEHFMREVPPDWGQIYLGGQHLHREPEAVSPFVFKPFNVNKTHAFALSKETIPKFLQHIMHAPDYVKLKVGDSGDTLYERNHFDMAKQLGRAHERNEWKTYSPIWWLAGQEKVTSQKSEGENVRMWWNSRTRGQGLPFIYISSDSDITTRQLAQRYLHSGYNLIEDSLTDIGINGVLDDDSLLHWLNMIAGEAVELWKLPGFEIPKENCRVVDQARRLWDKGVIEFDEALVSAISRYPQNGLCGGIPHVI